MTRPNLTRTQLDTLDFIAAFIRGNRVGPTIREVTEGVGMKSRGSAHRIIKILIDRGYLIGARNLQGHLARGSLAIAPERTQAAVTVFVAPNGEYVRTESSGDVSVTVRTHFPTLENSHG